MKFTFNPAPNLRQKQSTKRIMLELMLGLLAVFAFSVYFYYDEYGADVALQCVLLMVISLAVAFVTETLWALFTRQKLIPFLSGSFGWITAIILTMMCPVTITPYALGIATFFSIFVGKLLFGGFGQNIFNPAAFGRAVIFASFAGATTDVITAVTPTTLMATEYNWLVVDPNMISKLMTKVGGLGNLFVGFYPGAIGETSALMIMIVGVILALRKVIDWRIPAIYLCSVFVFASVIAITAGMSDWLWYPLFHLFSGGVMFGAVFMLTDPVTSPTSAQGKCIFALGAAILTVLIRVKGNYPEGVLYSILIMNMLTPMIEKATDGKQLVVRKKSAVIFAVVAVLGAGCVSLAASVIEPAKEKVKEKVFVKLDDPYLSTLQANIDSTVDNGDGTTTYIVTAQGFAAVEGPNMPNYDHPTDPNVYEIIVNRSDNTVKSVRVTKMSDTEYIGDKVESPKFLSQFEGLSLDSEFEIEVNDAVTGATYTSKSVVRAVLEVRNALGF